MAGVAILVLLMGLAMGSRSDASRIRNSLVARPDASHEVASADPVTVAEVQYNQDDAKSFASLSSASYCDRVDMLEDWSCQACIDSKIKMQKGKVRVIDDGWKNKVRLIVGNMEDQTGCAVIFRGTDNIANWLRNLEFWRQDATAFEDCEGCAIHAGFAEIWKNVKSHLLQALNEVGCGASTPAGQKIHITGHSLGASVTHIAMLALKAKGFGIAKSYSFEAARVGNQAFSDAFQSHFNGRFPVFRVTNNMDAVPHIPFASWGFVHVDTEVWYDDKGNYTICPQTESASCADQFWNVPNMLINHFPDHCGTPLVPNRDFCNPVGCLNTELAAPSCMTTSETACVFPFRYKGVLYDSCTSEGWFRDWCATATDSENNYVKGSRDWGSCQKTCKVRPWECHKYENGQNSKWCASANNIDGYKYKSTPKGGLCGDCECCKQPVPDKLAAFLLTASNASSDNK